MLCHDKLCCCNKGQPLTQDVFCSIMIKVSVLWEVVDLGAHATLHPYKQTDRNIRDATFNCSSQCVNQSLSKIAQPVGIKTIKI